MTVIEVEEMDCLANELIDNVLERQGKLPQKGQTDVGTMMRVEY